MTDDQSEIAGWVFQGNPNLYDIDTYLSRSPYLYWVCKPYVDRVQIGMPAFLKRSGPQSGIIASGRIAERATTRDQVEFPDCLGSDLWQVSPEDDDKVVGIEIIERRLTSDEGMIEYGMLAQIPELRKHQLVTFRQGTTFALSAHQLLAIVGCWDAEGQLPAPTVESGATEGRRVQVVHHRIERSRRLAADKRAAFRSLHGKLFCEVCGADHQATYEDFFDERLFEVHHLVPLAELEQPRLVRLDDLLLVCRNCHSLIHRTDDAEGNLLSLQHIFTSGVESPSA